MIYVIFKAIIFGPLVRTNCIKIQSHKLGELKLGNINLIRHLETTVFPSAASKAWLRTPGQEFICPGPWLVSGDLDFGLVSTMPSMVGSLGLNSLHQTPELLLGVWNFGIQKVLKKCPAPNRHSGLWVSCGLPW